MTILIKRDPSLEPFDPLAVIEELPPRWNGPHVGQRITEGFVAFRASPLGDKGGAASACRPCLSPQRAPSHLRAVPAAATRSASSPLSEFRPLTSQTGHLGASRRRRTAAPCR
jgi:hypothetical protein